MDFAEKIETRYYYCSLPYGERGTEERTAHQTKQNELNTEFNADLRAYLLALGVPEQYADKVAAVAYDQGHSGGYGEVFCHAQILADIFAA